MMGEVIIQKNKAEQIRISEDVFNGQPIVHVRTYWQHRETGDYLPSKKGLAFSRRHLDDVVEGLASLQEVSHEKTRGEFDG